jgi:poly(A) polymerase Pap1
MLSLGVSSFFLAILDVKHYTQIQLKPHISRDHQVRNGNPLISVLPVYWRIPVLAPLYTSSCLHKFERVVRRRVALISYCHPD